MKKMLVMVIAVLMILTTACSSGGKESAQDAKGTPDASSEKGNEGPVTISIVYKDMAPDDPWIKAVEDGMKAEGKNVKLEFVPVQSGTYSEKLGLLLQSGTIPDLIYFQGGDYQFAVTQKILEDLTPYIEKSTYVKAAMNPYNQERTANYPYLVWLSPSTTKVPVVRQDFFDKTTSGKTLLENPSIENYYNFFKEVKEKNGAKFAYTVPGDLDELDAVFAQAFGLTSTWLKGEDGKYAFGRTTKFEKEKLEFYAKLYKEGLLDPEFLTKKWDTKEKAFYDGQAAVIAGTQGKVIDMYNSKSVSQNGKTATVMPLPPAKGVGEGYLPIDVSKESRGIAISSVSKNKDMAFAVLEFLASPKGQMLEKLGIEGEHYTIENDKIKFTDKYAEWYARFVDNNTNFKPDKEFDPTTPFLSEAATKSLDMVASKSTKDNTFIIPEDLQSKYDAAMAVYKEFAANVVTGKTPIDQFDKFVQDWNAAGGSDLTTKANEVIK
ncbi:extracellular solute-binding protein [Paenibacillus dokdonensis]|uniref:extracellular solute-binding protein n=1 Tax=Paenibacillus dokdonensis TaxID=2567944 RepID=UPI0010A8E8D4|nr:extracellular solute-binding protein [Paenibacillus dokdonensis]